MKQLAGRNIVVFDLEIKNEIGKNGVTWETFERMGISVGCSFSFQTMDYKAYMDDNLGELADQLNRAELVVGFNILGFDLPLLRAELKNQKLEQQIRPGLPVYDMLEHSRLAAGWKPHQPYPKGLRLDNHLAGTFGRDMMKTEAGADAPVFWQQKKLGRLVSYCLADVRREAALFRRAWDTGVFRTDTHGEKSIHLRPQDLLGPQPELAMGGAH